MKTVIYWLMCSITWHVGLKVAGMKIQRGDKCAFKRGAKMIGLPGVHWLLFIGISRYGMKLLRRPESVANTYNELILLK